MKKNLYGSKYEDWVLIAGWGMTRIEETQYYASRRMPLPPELKEKRRLHMIELRDKGAPYSWIARLYKLSRMQALRIVKGLPNN